MTTLLQDVVHAVCGVSLSRRHDVGVEVQGGADHRVAEGVHDHSGLDALGKQKRRADVPQIVETDSPDGHPLAGRLEVPDLVARLDWCSDADGEYRRGA